MHKIAITTDSTCDLPADIVAQYGITVVPLSIQIGGKAFLDGVELTRDAFYTRLPDLRPHPTTATPGPELFRQRWDKLADAGAQAILSIHISEGLSGTINAARVAARQFARLPVTVLDSGQLSLGLGFIVERAAQLAESGLAMEDILKDLDDLMKRTYVFAALKTTEYLRRSGRLHFAVSALGEILQIKPLLHMHQGVSTAHRARTHSKAIARLLEWLDEYAPLERLAVLHAGVAEEAEKLRQRVQAYLPAGHIPVVQITPVLGAHLGIGALGFACISKKETVL